MTGLSKSRIIMHRQCPKRLWLKINKPEVEVIDKGMAIGFTTGDSVGDKARALYPDGLLIDPPNLTEALAQTKTLLNESPKPLFEATFEHKGTLIRADLLLPEEHGWRMVEVKSSTSVKPYHLEDAAVQAYVLAQNNVPVSRIEIAHIDNQFVYQGDDNYQGLLKYQIETKTVNTLAQQVPDWIAQAQNTLTLKKEPNITAGNQCNEPFGCSFRRYCDPQAFEPVPVTSPKVLPRGGKYAKQLIDAGTNDLTLLAEAELSKAVYQRIWRTLQTGQAELDQKAKAIIEALPYPYYHIDFETINLAIPVWAGTRPYQQVPFQWSCHIQVPDSITHHAFLGDGLSDPRREFTESLLATLGKEGTIFVYNAAFEKSRLKEMGDAFPEHKATIEALMPRIFDLLPLMRNHYYHPDMKGSWSIKAVLPTIAPDLSYKALTVGHGGAAMEAFAEMMKGETTPERRAELYQALLDYCELDTLAMVRIVDFLLKQRDR
jgi:hypothetical protein